MTNNPISNEDRICKDSSQKKEKKVHKYLKICSLVLIIKEIHLKTVKIHFYVLT